MISFVHAGHRAVIDYAVTERFGNPPVEKLCVGGRAHEFGYVLHRRYFCVKIAVVAMYHATRIPVEDTVPLHSAV